MSLSKAEAKQLLERMVFAGDRPDDWTQDVWGLSPTLGETAARLVDAFQAVVECCPEETLENLVQGLYRDYLEDMES